MIIKSFEKQLLVSVGSKDISSRLSLDGIPCSHKIFDYSDISDTEYYRSLICHLKEIVTFERGSEAVTVRVEGLDESKCYGFLLSAVWLLKFFIQTNFTGPSVELDDGCLEFLQEVDELKSEMVLDGEDIQENVRHPATLLIVKELLNVVPVEMIPSVTWWKMRCDFLHETILEEKSNVLWPQIKSYEDILRQQLLSTVEDKILGALFCLEMAQMYLFHYEVTTAKDLVSYASTLTGINVSLAGALGKRTKYQQNELAQLIVQVTSVDLSSDDGCSFSLLDGELPRNIPLNDDTRLNKIHLSNATPAESLSPIQQIILLNFYFVRKSFQAQDDVTRTECEAFLTALLDSPQVWVVQFVSLLHRSVLEKSHTRTVERSLEQLEVLKENLKVPSPPLHQRLPFFFTSYMPPWFKVESVLAEIYKSLGSINSALDVYLRLSLWESAIDCYNTLQLRHKAEEIIRKELEKGETVKLWCLLGDATDNTEFYEKAWLLSNGKSSRTQRQWGYFHFHRKQYVEAVEHLEKAVSLNPLEYPAWMRLAFAAMQVENWELCAKAYRHSCILDSDNFESWNNLSNAYLKLGDKLRAMKVLIEATKCDYNIWQVWDNLLVVATDCRAFEEVIRSYERLLDLKDKHTDPEVLGVLTKFICENLEDSKSEGCIKYLKPALKLFGRLTANVTTNGTIWKLYSDLLATQDNFESGVTGAEVLHRSVDCSQKSIRCLMQDPKWDKIADSIKLVVEYSLNVADRTLEFSKKYSDSSSVANFKTTAIFTISRVIASIKKRKSELITETDAYDSHIEELENKLQELKTN
ncbi:unnamed protein product [Allacma fusca]|uniref:Tetratricopeptide repeat protein 27 n=1 Tax=Allacma fusca TaxID=39272 RepID=A0A8J2PZ25_9HEXA|nr:unnamed protein product [Allacma fusca]